MAEETEENVEETTEPPAEEALAEDAAPAGDAEAVAEEAAGAPAAEAAPAPEEAAPAAEEEAPATPKERRRKARAAKAAAAPARQQLTPEERQAERDAERKRKGGVRRSRRLRLREKAKRSEQPTREPLAPRVEQHPGQQKTRQGVVVSDRAAKTITVRIDVARRHPRYEKIVRTSRTLHVHDEQGDAHVGDTVIVRECRPMSRTKRWRLVEVVERAK